MERKAQIFLASLIGWFLLSAFGDSTLFAPPVRGGSSAPAPTVADSLITLTASITYDALSRLGATTIPNAFEFDGSGNLCAPVPSVESHRKCTKVPYCNIGLRSKCGIHMRCINLPDTLGSSNICSGYHWHIDAAKQGPLSVAGSDSDLKVSQGAHIAGKAGLNGDLARIFSLSGKAFSADVNPSFNLGATLGRDWCPIVSLHASGRWVDNASAEIIGRNCVGINLGILGHPQACAGPVNLGLADELNKQLDKYKDEIPKAAQAAIPCGSVKPKIASQWHPLAIKIERDTLPTLYLNFQPKSAGFSGIIPEANQLRFAIRVGAQTVLATTPVDTAVLPLPTLDPLNADHGNLQINLQAVASYEVLKKQLRQVLVNESFQKELPVGKVDVRIEDVDVYPSKDSLALGLKIDAKIPGHLLNTTGWVYLSGKPAVVKDGKSITVENINFAAVVDNAFWSVVQPLFQDEILKALNAHATFDLSKEIDKASEEIAQEISKADVPGLKINFGTPSLSLDNVYVTSDNLVIVVKLAMPVDAEVTEAILK